MVVEDDAGYAAALAELAGAGWRAAQRGGPADPRTCFVHPVRDRRDAEAVVVAALRGEAVLARIESGPSSTGIADDLLDDLSSIGPVLLVNFRTALRLDRETWLLVHELARGATLDAAARALHIAPRTANRRVSTARLALGANSRAQLVRALLAPGRIPPAGPGPLSAR